jgi:hypothetical protein
MMADITVNVLTPATVFDLLTLAEARAALGTVSLASLPDSQLQLMITENSDVIATLCNRVFAKEKVQETWRWDGCLCLGNPHIFLQRWPVKTTDVATVESPSGSTISDWALEEKSGKLSNYNSWQEPAVVTYTGGYVLPGEAPPALKQACGLLIRTAYFQLLRASTTGIRSISHRESRVMYFDPNILAKLGAGTVDATLKAMQTLLSRYMRVPV